jgi:hypothetical protein
MKSRRCRRDRLRISAFGRPRTQPPVRIRSSQKFRPACRGSKPQISFPRAVLQPAHGLRNHEWTRMTTIERRLLAGRLEPAPFSIGVAAGAPFVGQFVSIVVEQIFGSDLSCTSMCCVSVSTVPTSAKHVETLTRRSRATPPRVALNVRRHPAFSAARGRVAGPKQIAQPIRQSPTSGVSAIAGTDPWVMFVAPASDLLSDL